MILRKKNIFGFATIAATVTLSAAIFATGCGDSGDSTAVNPLNPGKIANAITVYYGDEATLKANNVESLSWIITDGDGKQLAVRKTAQKINYTGTTTKANAALAEEDTTSNDTTADETPASATQNDKCYVVLGVPSTVFQNMDKVTLTYIYYDKSGKIVGFGSDINEVTWNNDKSGKRYSGTVADGNFFSAEGVKSELVATPEFINKGETTKLAYNVTSGKDSANIIGLVDVEVGYDDEDKDTYIQPTDDGIVGAYKGVNFTSSNGVYVESKFDKTASDVYARVYVTDRTPSALGISTDGIASTVLVPENVKAEGQTKAADYALGQTEATSSTSKYTTYGVRQLPLEVYVSDWSDGKSAKPSVGLRVPTDKVTFAVKDSTSKDIKDTAVENGVVKFTQAKLDAAVPFTVVATYGKATGKLEGGKAVPATVEVGFAGKDATEFTTAVKGDSTKDVTANLKMYARFVADGVDGLSLFEIPSNAGFTYPSTAALFDADSKIYNAKDATVTIAGVDQQKANDYTVTIKKDNQKDNLSVKFVKEKETAYDKQIEAFGAFTKLNIDNLLNMVIAPKTEVDPTPSPSPDPGGNEDPDTGDEP